MATAKSTAASVAAEAAAVEADASAVAAAVPAVEASATEAEGAVRHEYEALRDFTASAFGQVLSFVKGQEIAHEIGHFLHLTGSPVKVKPPA